VVVPYVGSVGHGLKYLAPIFSGFSRFFLLAFPTRGWILGAKGWFAGVGFDRKTFGPIYQDLSAFVRRDLENSNFRTPNAPPRGGFRLMKVYAHWGCFGSNFSFFH